MSTYPKKPEDFLTPEKLAELGKDRCAAAAYIMGECIPFNKLMGIEILEVTEVRALLKLPYTEQIVGDPFRPALHGGALAMLADTAGGTAALAATGHGDKVSTLDMRIDYLRGANLKDTFAEALIVRAGSRAVVVRIHVYQEDASEPDGRLHVADSTAVFSVYATEG
ncbi:MAG: hypothetical protein ACI9D0_001225 [Bacteroidia bacterium]|jgi:uncharacterized protein (TIGR00369 family)